MSDEAARPGARARVAAAAEGPGRKHLPAYLDEMAFRRNNRDNPYLLRDTLVHLLSTASLPYSELVARS